MMIVYFIIFIFSIAFFFWKPVRVNKYIVIIHGFREFSILISKTISSTKSNIRNCSVITNFGRIQILNI